MIYAGLVSAVYFVHCSSEILVEGEHDQYVAEFVPFERKNQEVDLTSIGVPVRVSPSDIVSPFEEQGLLENMAAREKWQQRNVSNILSSQLSLNYTYIHI